MHFPNKEKLIMKLRSGLELGLGLRLARVSRVNYCCGVDGRTGN